jgi:hypothetical protein
MAAKHLVGLEGHRASGQGVFYLFGLVGNIFALS